MLVLKLKISIWYWQKELVGNRVECEDHKCLSLNSKISLCFIFLLHVEEAREELRDQVYNAMGENESRKPSEESLVETRVQAKNKDAEVEEVREEKAAVNIDDNLAEKEKSSKQVEDMQEKQISEKTVEDSLEGSAAAEEKPEETTGGENLAAEETQEDIVLKKILVVDKTPGEEKLIVEKPAEAASGDTVEKEVTAEEKLALQKMEQKAEKLVVLTEKHTNAKLENSMVEASAKTSQETLEEKELVSAVDKVERKAEKAEQTTVAIQETDIVAGQEKVDLKEEEKLNEPIASGEVLPTAPNEITSPGVVEQSREIEIEEKAEAAAKVEKEEEKDHEMGEGEGNRDRKYLWVVFVRMLTQIKLIHSEFSLPRVREGI